MSVKDMVFEQQKIKTLIDSTYEKDRLNHAYLLYGDDGVGKKEMAYYFACKLYCPNKGCMECAICQNILQGKHLNVEYIGVLDNKKLLSKEQITDLQEEFSKTSLVEGPRIYIVDGIDTATVAAQNSLLKFIEEPQNNEQTYGLFIAKDKSKVVSTIQSRCNLLYFPTLNKKSLIDSIEGVDLKTKNMFAYLTNSKSEIIEFSKNEDMLNIIELALKFIEIKNPAQAIMFYLTNNSFLVDKNLDYFLKLLVVLFEDVIHYKYNEEILFYSVLEKIKQYSNKISTDSARTYLEEILKLQSRISYNVISKNILHELIIKIHC